MTHEEVLAGEERLRSGKSVLDVGCNAGFYSLEAERRGAARVVGIDAQRFVIQQALFVRPDAGTRHRVSPYVR